MASVIAPSPFVCRLMRCVFLVAQYHVPLVKRVDMAVTKHDNLPHSMEATATRRFQHDRVR